MAKQYDAEVDLIAGSGGVFEINVDGEFIYSKRKLNRFPEDGEVIALIDSSGK